LRILLTTEGSRGDVFPMLALGEACAAEGHTVRVCAPPNFEADVAARGFEFHPSGIDALAMLREHAGAVRSGGLRLVLAFRRSHDDLVRDGFAPVCEAARGADFVLGAGVQVAGPSAAEKLGIPYRFIAYCPSLIPAADLTPVFLQTPELPPWANRVLWRLMPWLVRRSLSHINRKRRELGLGPERDAFDHLFGPAPVALATDEDLGPPPRESRFEVECIGALQTDVEGPLPDKLEAFLAAGPPPVYFGFGSMTDPAPAETTRLVLDATLAAGCRALLSRGWAGLGEGGLPEHVFPLGAVSHARLFPRCAAVVHHGGAGTTTTAARAGVPQVLVPHLLDQFYWARRVAALGLGPPAIPRARLSAGALAERLLAILDNEFLRECTQAFGERLRARDPLRPENRKALIRRLLSA
jgi:vancomycin aglycone glucosyltransferase